MNKKGQVLVMFIILLPILILLIGGIIELSNIYYKKNEATSVTKIIVNNIEEKSKDDIINIYKDNKIDVSSIDIKSNKIKVTYNVPSIFGNLIGKDKYKVTLDFDIKKG